MNNVPFPADVQGRYRTRRLHLSYLLIAIFLSLPWLRVGGFPAVLLDIPNRRFAFFGLHFWAHDVPLLFLLAASVILAVALVTTLWGRIWCGWACPQTVFGDLVFRRIERAIEGDSVARHQLSQARWGLEKAFKRATKWSLFALLSLILSHTFLAYFVGTDALESMIRSPPSQSPTAFLIMSAIFCGILFDLGWFRERFCVQVCPYGRLQSVLHDEGSRIIFYDTKRGEPRGKLTATQATGACVDCQRCVRVCPTGIDIRNGLQLECIACTSCVDACDAIMTKLKRPTGLIRYAQEVSINAIRPRTVLYFGLLATVLAGLSWILILRTPLELTLVRAVGEPYQLAKDENGRPMVINHFHLDIQNQTFFSQVLVLKPHTMSKIELVTPGFPDSIAPGAQIRADLFVKFAPPRGGASSNNTLVFQGISSRLQAQEASSPTNEVEGRLLAPL